MRDGRDNAFPARVRLAGHMVVLNRQSTQLTLPTSTPFAYTYTQGAPLALSVSVLSGFDCCLLVSQLVSGNIMVVFFLAILVRLKPYRDRSGPHAYTRDHPRASQAVTGHEHSSAPTPTRTPTRMPSPTYAHALVT